MIGVCSHPFRRVEDGWYWHCISCGAGLGPVSKARACGCPADPLVFGHICSARGQQMQTVVSRGITLRYPA